MKTIKVSAIIVALAMLVGCGAKPDSRDVTEGTKSTAAQSLISADDAKAIALEHIKSSAEGAVAEDIAALIDKGDISDESCEPTAKNGIPIFDYSFTLGKFEFEYEIDSQNGAIRSYTRQIDNDFKIAAGSPSIGEDAALSYALWYLDIGQSDIENAASEYNWERIEYIVRFTAGGKDYICAISTNTGAFLRSNVDIGPFGADEIAYNHAAQNVAEDQRDDFNNLMLAGVLTNKDTKTKGTLADRNYVVHFAIGGYEYEYQIDGLNGNILKAECETDDDWTDTRIGGFDSKTVSLEKPELLDYFEEFYFDSETESE